MFTTLPKTAFDVMHWDWERIAPFFADLETRPLAAENIDGWLADWTRLAELIEERYWRHYVATTIDTENQEAQHQFEHFIEHIRATAQQAEQKLKHKLIDSRLEPAGFELPLKKMRAQAELFREENLPLEVEEQKLARDYERIVSTQTVQWEGKEQTLQQLALVYQDSDRSKRKAAWQLAVERRHADKKAIDALWAGLVKIRRQIAANAGLPDYRAYRWQKMLRFDYTPEDCTTFHRAIEAIVVPAAARIYERRRKRLGLTSLRPWDLFVDPFGLPPLRPFATIEELTEKTKTIFRRVDAVFSDYFDRLRSDNLLDLDNRPGKMPGAYSISFDATKQPFIFVNAVGTHDDVMTLLHEGGHAFHAVESAHLPYFPQRAGDNLPLEFAEVASMGMELLAAPYLTTREGGFYTDQEAARARIEQLEGIVTFLPYMAVVDAFQHWVYTHIDEAVDPARCDESWLALWGRFMKGIDWSGQEQTITARWRQQGHPFSDPFYYVEYGLAQLGAIQVWRNALQDQAQAVAAYRHALSLGASVPLPDLYRAAGATLAFDTPTVQAAIDLLETVIAEQEAQL
ncbi:MAG: M3 family oligoendopeptidase [Anaerolineae bacterium]|nr:M3 family oligoendopeptidase [Anaerolineae bacterium]